MSGKLIYRKNGKITKETKFHSMLDPNKRNRPTISGWMSSPIELGFVFRDINKEISANGAFLLYEDDNATAEWKLKLPEQVRMGDAAENPFIKKEDFDIPFELTFKRIAE